MKRTLRVLFLAVLAMALMASGAMAKAKVTSVDVSSFDVTVKVDGSAQTLSPKGTSTDVSTDVVAVSADQEVIITFAFKDTPKKNVSADSYDFEVTFDPTSSATYFNVSGDKTKISGDKAFTVKLSDDAGVAVPETKISFKVTSGGTTLFTYTIKVKVDAAGSTTPTTPTTPTIKFDKVPAARSFTLLMSGDKPAKNGTASFDVVLIISGDDDGLYTVDMVISDDGSYADYFDFTVEENTDATSDTGTVYTVTLTPVSLDKAGTKYDFYFALISDDSEAAKTEVATMTVIVSSDANGKATSTWELDVEADTEKVELSYYGTKDVTLTIEPAEVTPTVEVTADDGITVTEKKAAATTSAVSTTKVYTIKAGEKSGDFAVTFSVSATSGDTQSMDVDVDVTVKFDSTKKPGKPELVGLNSLPAAYQALFGDGVTFYSDPVKLAAAFAEGKGVVAWATRAAGPVKFYKAADWRAGKVGGWVLFFLKVGASSRTPFYVKQYQGVLSDVAKGSAFIAASQVSSDDCLIDPVSADVAIYQVDLENTALGFASPDKYGVNSSYVLSAYEDNGSSTESEAEKAGTLTATGSSNNKSGGVLGNSSGGCDAGFGAMALALAATLFLGKKRS